MRHVHLAITILLSLLLSIFHDNVWMAGLLGLLLFTNGYFVGYMNKSPRRNVQPNKSPARNEEPVVLEATEDWALVKNPNGTHTKIMLLADK